MKEFDELAEMVTQASDDIIKAEAGNHAAGVRARRVMLDIKNKAADVRKKLVEIRNDKE